MVAIDADGNCIEAKGLSTKIERGGCGYDLGQPVWSSG